MGTPTITKPAFCSEKHLKFLDRLRESGATNMFGAVPYLQDAYENLSRKECREVLAYWMQTFSERHPDDSRG